MAKVNLLLCIFLFLSFSISAQIDIPYNTTWETTAGQNEWTQYRFFDTQSYDWGFNNLGGLTHDYPVGNTQGDTITDWMVSPALNFYSTSTLSFNAKTYTFGPLQSLDYFGIWFSSGSKDPNDGDYVEIINLKEFSPGNIWSDTMGVELPYTAAEGYIAIVYIEATNWFTVGMSDLVVTPDNPLSYKNIDLKESIAIHPNPVSDFIYIKKENQEVLKYQILDVNGSLISCGNLTDEINNITFTEMNSGIYFVKIINPKTQEFMVEKIVVL